MFSCKVDGCAGEVRYKSACLCQKHYFRNMRNGTLETKREIKKREHGFTRQPKIVMPGRGYVRLYIPDHPLADTQGYVAEHRKVVFDKIGHFLDKCELCGKPENWETVHIDHKDNDPKNNDPSNLRPLCRSCNTWRSYPEQHTIAGRRPIAVDEFVFTATEWARVLGGRISGATITRRIAHGMPHEQALLSLKRTHNSNQQPELTREGLIELAKQHRAMTRLLRVNT